MEVGKSWLGSRSAVGRSVGDTGRQQISREFAVQSRAKWRAWFCMTSHSDPKTLRAFNNCYNSTLQLFIIHVASFISKYSIARRTCSAARGRRACSCVTRMRCFRSDQRKNKWYGVEGADEECQLGSQSVPWLLTGQVWSSILVPAKCAATCDCRTRRGSLQLGGGAEDSHNIACGRM